MVVIVMEEVTFPDGSIESIKEYKTDSPFLTADLKKKGEENDNLIEQKLRNIEREMKELGILQLKGKKNQVIKLWHAIGTRLSFVDEMELSSRARVYVWRALFDHRGELYHHIKNIPKRVKRSPKTSHFHYCYIIGRWPWEFVDSAGNWTAWVEFLDSKVIREDNRIIEWIDSVQERICYYKNWVRILNKAIRTFFYNKDPTVFDDDEIEEILNQIVVKAFRLERVPSS